LGWRFSVTECSMRWPSEACQSAAGSGRRRGFTGFRFGLLLPGLVLFAVLALRAIASAQLGAGDGAAESIAPKAGHRYDCIDVLIFLPAVGAPAAIRIVAFEVCA
jgi:hypothetical protein